MSVSDTNSWETYSKLVLQQLETLSRGVDALRDELHDVKNELTDLKAKEDRVQDLKSWKDKMDDVASPPQIRSALREIDELKTFKTKAIATFMAVQTMMGIIIAWTKTF